MSVRIIAQQPALNGALILLVSLTSSGCMTSTVEPDLECARALNVEVKKEVLTSDAASATPALDFFLGRLTAKRPDGNWLIEAAKPAAANQQSDVNSAAACMVRQAQLLKLSR